MPKKTHQDKQSLRVTGRGAHRRGHIAGIKDLLAIPGGLLAETRKRQELRSNLMAWLGEMLPSDLHAHLRGAEMRGDELLVYADSAAWSSRLRYALTALMPQIRARDPAVTQVRVRVRP